MPSRSSSDPKLRSPNSLSQGESGTEQQESQVQPVSKAGNRDIERNGSVANSQRAKEGERSTEGAENQRAALATSNTPLPNKKKSKRLPKFLSFLNCCSASENANSLDVENQTVPARKVSKLQPSQVRQATPVKKPDTSAPESSTAESKETTDEKIAGPPYSDIKAAEQPKIQERPTEHISTSAATNVASRDEKDGSRGGIASTQQPFSDIDQGPTSTASDVSIAAQRGNSLGNPIVQDSTTSIPVVLSPQMTTHQEDAIMDRTPEQEQMDNDIEMPDAPPEDPVIDEEMKDAEAGETEAAQSLPPPPPIPPQNDLNTTSAASNRNSTYSTGLINEKQTWLLPPVRPEFHGKKCLVLDLDETLVHSSFKVRAPIVERHS